MAESPEESSEQPAEEPAAADSAEAAQIAAQTEPASEGAEARGGATVVAARGGAKEVAPSRGLEAMAGEALESAGVSRSPDRASRRERLRRLAARRWVRHLAAFLFFVIVTFILEVPHWRHLQTQFAGDTGDPSLYIWTWRWEAHIFATGDFSQFWQSNFFYPNHWVVAYTEHILPLMPLYAIFEWLTGSAVAAYNLMYITLFVLAGWCAYLLALRVTGSYAAAIAGGLLFGFCPTKVAQTTHMHVSAVFLVPIGLLLVHKLVRRPAAGTAAWLGCAWAVQALMSYYLGFVLWVAIGAYLLVAVAQKHNRAVVRSVGYVFAGLAFGLVLVMPLTWPYLGPVKDEVDTGRNLTEIMYFSAHPKSYFQPSANAPLYKLLPAPFGRNSNGETQVFAGAALSLLALIGLLSRRRLPADAAANSAAGGGDSGGGGPGDSDPCGSGPGASRPGGPGGSEDDAEEAAPPVPATIKNIWLDERLRWLAVALAGAALALGPVVQVSGPGWEFPGPYKALMLAPGASGMRVPGRFAYLMYLGLAMLAAIAVSAMFRRGPAAKVLVAAVVLFAVAEFHVKPPDPVRVAADATEVPAEYKWLRSHPPGPVVELPMYAASYRGAITEAYRLYLSSYDWDPRLNGYSGYFPRDYWNMVTRMRSFPSRDSILELQELGVRYVVVHKNELQYETLRADVLAERARQWPELTLVASSPATDIYEVAPLSAGEGVSAAELWPESWPESWPEATEPALPYA